MVIKHKPSAVPWLGAHITTPFESRLLTEFDRLRADRTARVLYAESGAGKSVAKQQAVRTAGGYKAAGETYLPILSARIPHNGPQTADKLVIELIADSGLLEETRAVERRRVLVDFIASSGVELIVIDDFHEVSMAQCDVIRELSDMLPAPVGWAYLAALAAKDPADCDPMLMLNEAPPRLRANAFQFTRRLEDDPWVLIDGHSPSEVGDILLTFQTLYAEQLPGLHLEPLADQVFAGLTDPRVDWLGMGTVRMNAIAGFVRRMIKRLAREGGTGQVTEATAAEELEAYAQRDQTYILSRDRKRGSAADVRRRGKAA